MYGEGPPSGRGPDRSLRGEAHLENSVPHVLWPQDRETQVSTESHEQVETCVMEENRILTRGTKTGGWMLRAAVSPV